MKLPFNLLDVIDNTPGSAALTGTVRVLGFGERDGIKIVWVIDFARRHPEKKTQSKAYARKPYQLEVQYLSNLIISNRAYVLKLQTNAALSMKDEDRLLACAKKSAELKLLKRFKERDFHYEAIRPLVCHTSSSIPRLIDELMADGAFAYAVKTRAKELSISETSLRNWINKFWQGGSQKNALLNGYENCGGKGVEKKQEKKLGRSNRLYKAGLANSRGYPLTKEDKERLKCGFLLINRETPPRDAFLLVSGVHWANHVVNKDGVVRAELYEPHLRPTFDQFLRWGAKLNQKTVSQYLLGTSRWSQNTATKGGSERDSIVAIGQQSMFDGTSSDVYCTSFSSRLIKLPPMTRLILKESRVGLIYGLYLGWESASPKTALRAILNGADPNKDAWARRWYPDYPAGAMPSILTRAVLTDNGELKAQEPTEAEQQFGFSILFTEVYRGDRKGGIESQHHADHSHVDRRIPGSTKGKPRKRGEPHPAIEGILNYAEYMRELLKHIVWHNCEQEVPDLAPDEMLLEQPRIPPTRINIYKWLKNKRLDVSIPVDYEALRAFCLPYVDAVIRKNGIYLVAKIHGREMRLPRLRYSSQELVETGLLTQVKISGKDIRTRMKFDDSDLSQAWLPTRNGMIRVTTSERDRTILQKMTFGDWISYWKEEVLQKDLMAGQREQAAFNRVLERSVTIAQARSEEAAELALLPKRPSKRSLISNLDKNKKMELELLRQQDKAMTTAQIVTPQPPHGEKEAAASAAELAMQAFHASAIPS